MVKNKEKGFTLIELLAVIIILGVLMVIAIPAVTSYIQNSRKSAYVSTAHNIISAARTKVNDGTLSIHDTDTTYYLPYEMLKGENEWKSPYGDFEDAYVVVTFDGNGYDYYWTSMDTTNTGIYLTYLDLLDNDKVVNDMEGVDTTIGVGNRSKIVVYSDAGIASDPSTNVTDSIDEKESAQGGGGGQSPNTVQPVSFATDSWATITQAADRNILSAYSVGDTKTVDLGSLGVHTVRIVNMSTPSSCYNEAFSQTGCGFVVEFTDIIENRNFTSSSSNTSGWGDSTLRTYLNSTFYNALPSDLRAAIIDTEVFYGRGAAVSASDYVDTVSDQIFILSSKEIRNTSNGYDRADAYFRQLDYYAANASSTNYRKKLGNDYAEYWTRTVDSSSSDEAIVIASDGGNWYKVVNLNSGVSPAFRIGVPSE